MNLFMARLRRGTVIGAHVVLWASLVMVLAQLLYPSERVLPLANLNGQPVGSMSKDALLEHLDTLAADAQLTVETPVRTRTVPWVATGITLDRLSTAESLLHYEWWQRLIPFSSLVEMARPDHQLLTIIDNQRLDAFARDLAGEDQREVEEASIVIRDGEVIVEPAKAGHEFVPADIKRQLLAAPFESETTVVLKAKSTEASHSPAEVEAVADAMRQLLEQDVVLEFAGEVLRPDTAMVGEWLDVEEDSETGQLRPSLEREALQSYLSDLNERYASPPKPVSVTLLDGREIKRSKVEPSRAMNLSKAIEKIETVLLDPAPDSAINLPIEMVEPQVVYRRTYSKGSPGLDSLIRYWEQTTYGNYGIIVREIGGQNRYAEFGANKRFVTASTFKMFLAYAVYTKVEAEQIKLSDPSGLEGWKVHECMTEMIVNSTNPCAVALQDKLGQKEVNRIIHQAGFQDTDLDNADGSEKYTTVRDEADFLLRLYGGGLLNQGHSKDLLDLLKRQIWRGGIPSGVPPGVEVANKVGFYDGWVHDVAIVYSPKATYILAIMSRGGSDPVFAQLSRQVYGFFNR